MKTSATSLPLVPYQVTIDTKIPAENELIICQVLPHLPSHSDGPLYVIMEYACHGNLKDYLNLCRYALLQRNVSIHVASEEGKPSYR